jgi:hypothetical protein
MKKCVVNQSIDAYYLLQVSQPSTISFNAIHKRSFLYFTKAQTCEEFGKSTC